MHEKGLSQGSIPQFPTKNQTALNPKPETLNPETLRTRELRSWDNFTDASELSPSAGEASGLAALKFPKP